MRASFTPRGLVGVVHLKAMPGDPRCDGASFADVERFALGDGEALAKGGASAIIVENFGSAPFKKGCAGERTEPHQVAFLALVTRELMRATGLPVGVNCLRNDLYSALGIAAATGASFARVNVHSGAYVTDQGLIEGEAHLTMRYRQQLGAEGVGVLADVLVKHAAPLAPVRADVATHDVLDRGLADGVIVTGAATGAAAPVDVLREVSGSAGAKPVYIGSGLTPAQLEQVAGLIDGAIVGTYLKRGGQVSEPVDPGRVAEMAAALKGVARGRLDISGARYVLGGKG